MSTDTQDTPETPEAPETPKKSPAMIASENDSKLAIIVLYDITKGHTIEPDESLVKSKFTEFKNYVMNGEFTMESLEADVFSRWGILEEPTQTTTPTVQKSEDTGSSNRIIGFYGSNNG